jgi:outer membrane murein-binding lipoprotein Lpp
MTMNDDDRARVEALEAAVQELSARLESLEGKRKKSKCETPTAETWNRYAAAYERRYRVSPTRNGTVNSQLSNLVKRIGAEDAPAVAEFYVLKCSQPFYVRSCHPIGALLKDAEGLRTQWARGRTVTHEEARMADQTAARANAWGGLLEQAQ